MTGGAPPGAAPERRRPGRRPLAVVVAVLSLLAPVVVGCSAESTNRPPVAGSSADPAAATTAPSPAGTGPGEPPPGGAVVPAGSSGGPVRQVPGKAMIGGYFDLTGRTLAQTLRLRRKQLGREPRIVHLFYAWEDGLPDALADIPPGAVAMLSWRGTRYSDITSGANDARLAADGQALARYGKPIFLRWAWEMNGDWYLWCGVRNDGDTAGFIAAWQRMHKIFARQGATNVAWVWSPNHNSRPTDAWNERARYYPGDDYVDWVGVSGYNFRRESPDAMFGPIYREFADRKPLMIAEVGAVDRGGRTKPDWITALASWVVAHPRTGAVVWFDTDTHPGNPEKWRIDSDAAALQAYKRMATAPEFSG